MDGLFWLKLLPALLATGAVAGVLAGLLGVGGGIVIVPVLVFLSPLIGVESSVAMQFAVATSLTTIIATSIASARAHYQKGSIDLQLFRQWVGFVFTGALLGGWLGSRVSGNLLSGIFGGFALLVALNMLRPKGLVLADNPPRSWLSRAGIGGGIGLFSALMGIGGGTLTVPILTLCSFPMRLAVGTASLFGLTIALPAVFGFATAGQDIQGLLPLSLGFINLPTAFCIALGTTFCAPFGAKLAHSIEPKQLKIAFGLFLLLSASKMLYRTFF